MYERSSCAYYVFQWQRAKVGDWTEAPWYFLSMVTLLMVKMRKSRYSRYTVRGNTLISKYRTCSYDVKVQLFKKQLATCTVAYYGLIIHNASILGWELLT